MPIGFMLPSRDDTLRSRKQENPAGGHMRVMRVLIGRRIDSGVSVHYQLHGELAAIGEAGTIGHYDNRRRAFRSRRALRDFVVGMIVSGGLLLARPHAAPSSFERQQSPDASAAGLKTEAGLEVKLWAAEPQLSNPTNIAADARGRVWVLEGVNYRRQLRNQPDIR